MNKLIQSTVLAVALAAAFPLAAAAEPVKMNLTVAGEEVQLTIASTQFFDDPTYCGSIDVETGVDDHIANGITVAKFDEINDLMDITPTSVFAPNTMLCVG